MKTNDLLYLNEKLSNLIYYLLIGEENAKQRLKNNLLNFHRAFSLDFPLELETKKLNVIKQLTKFPKVYFADSLVMNEYENTIHKIKEKFQIKPITFSFGYFATSPEEENKLTFKFDIHIFRVNQL